MLVFCAVPWTAERDVSPTELSLHEKLFLLAQEPSSLPGPFKSKSRYVNIGVAGAILLLLVRGGRVTFQRGSFHVRGQLAVGDSEVDELLKDLESKAEPFRAQRIGRWLRRAARAKPQDAVISGLVSRKVLARKKGKLFLLQSEAREEVVQRVRQQSGAKKGPARIPRRWRVSRMPPCA